MPTKTFSDDYLEYINSPEWRRFRNGWFRRHGRFCRACGTAQGVIQLNHYTYKHMKRERDNEMVALCLPHHEQVTSLTDDGMTNWAACQMVFAANGGPFTRPKPTTPTWMLVVAFIIFVVVVYALIGASLHAALHG